MIAVVLSGGSGTRFWPLSRKKHPKQLLHLWSDEPMVATTCKRLFPTIPAQNILVACSAQLLHATHDALPFLTSEQFIVEPCPRNTASAIGLASIVALTHFGDDIIGVFPSDHFIGNDTAFHQCLNLAHEEALQNNIVTLGIPPTHPETGYGYIQTSTGSTDKDGVQDVISFVEKPDYQTALEYLHTGNYLWNAGIFFFKPSVLLKEFQRQQPAAYQILLEIKNALIAGNAKSTIDELFPKLPNISIDYAIIEQAENVRVVPATFQWSDVGQWAALADVMPLDPSGNVVHGDVVLDNVHNSIIYSTSTSRTITASYLTDTVIVDTGDAILVVDKANTQQVRAIVDKLDKLGRDDLL